MDFNLRKFRVWLISVGVLAAIYLVYSGLNRTPRIEVDRGQKAADVQEEFGGRIAMVGDVGVKEARYSRYTDYKDGRLVGEFGFARLLHELGNEWTLEKPYRNIFRPGFKCFITADKGAVSVEMAAGRPNPKDATLSENVLIHIVPEAGSKIKECRIYLDDISFISDRSLFFTAGPVRFVSQDSLMTGRGLEIVYDDELDQLEYLKIIQLEQLRLKTGSNTALFSSKSKDGGTKSKPKVVLSDNADRQVKESGGNRHSDVKNRSEQKKQSEQKKLYRCLFRDNVVVDAPEQVVFAQQIFINDIGLSQASDNSSSESKQQPEDSEKNITRHAVQDGNEPDKSEGYDDIAVADGNDFAIISDSDIVITCDGGIVVKPMDTEVEPYVFAAESDRVESAEEDKGGRTKFTARRIDYSAVTEDIVANGASELNFFIKGVGAEKNGEKTVPVKVVSQKKVRFLSALNRAVFEGDSFCTMVEQDSGIRQEYKLSGEKIVVDLSDSASDIRAVRAEGQVVRLSSVKKAGDEFLGGVELKCRQMDFDNDLQMVTAAGPGVIVVDNSKLTEPRRRKRTGKFSLQKRCYALVEGFDTLKYFLASGRVVAEADNQQLGIGYVPVVRGENKPATRVSANRIDAQLVEITGGRKELSRLDATGGITYEDAEQQFVGSELYYNGKKSLITVKGNDIWPCLLNGVLVDGIKYNLRSGRAGKAKIVGPGVLR